MRKQPFRLTLIGALSILVMEGLRAHAQTVSDADLSAARAECQQHFKFVAPANPRDDSVHGSYQWDPGYGPTEDSEGCPGIYNEFQARAEARQKSGAAISELAKRLKAAPK